MANVEIQIKTVVDKAIADLNKTSSAVSGVNNSAKEASSGSNALTTGLGKLTGALSVAALVSVATRELKKFAEESLEAASRSQELTAKFNTVFRDAAPKASAAIENFGDEVNRSNLDLKEMAADIQNVLVGMGESRDSASDMSVELVKLAVDVAAFNNMTDADVLDNFQSALTGNVIAAKKYGIILNEANMEAALFKMGVEGGTKAASEAEKVQARYNIIMESTADAHGAAAREAGSYANVSKGLTAAVLELQVAYGEQLIPTMTWFKKTMTEAVQEATNLTETQNLLKAALDAGAISTWEYINNRYLLSEGYKITREELEDLVSKYEEENGVIVDTVAYTRDLTAAEMAYQGALDSVTAAQQELEAAQQSWLSGTANEVVSQLQNLNINNTDYMEALQAIDDVMGTNEVAEQNHSDAIEEIVTQYGKTKDIDAFTTSLATLRDAELPQTTEKLEEARLALDDVQEAYNTLAGIAENPIDIMVNVIGNDPNNILGRVTLK